MPLLQLERYPEENRSAISFSDIERILVEGVWIVQLLNVFVFAKGGLLLGSMDDSLTG